jgi:uncharacterized protein YdhG (YjbR/CyaY superfamily)
MLDFDERDLLLYAERAGFAEIHLELQIEMKQPRPEESLPCVSKTLGSCREGIRTRWQISIFPADIQVILEKVRQAIHKAAPEAAETMSYAIPTFDLNGKHVVFFAGWKHHISLYPLPAGDEAFQQAIAHYKRAKGSIPFSRVRDSDERATQGDAMKQVQSADGTTIAYDQKQGD